MISPPSGARVIGLAVLALLIFSLLFHFERLGPFDFWDLMAAGILLLNGLALTDPRLRAALRNDIRTGLARKILIGAATAVVLYAVFFVGNKLARGWFPFAGDGIAAVYALRQGVSTLKIWILIVFVIGPGEELFWRAYLQRRLCRQFGHVNGLAAGLTLYVLAHIASGNPMLLIAALVCGAAWGVLYMRFESAVANIVSHTLWDIAVFLVVPFV